MTSVCCHSMVTEKMCRALWQVEVAQAHLDSGFFIAAHSTAGSKFKLLLFEQSAEGQWELLMQASSGSALHILVLLHV